MLLHNGGKLDLTIRRLTDGSDLDELAGPPTAPVLLSSATSSSLPQTSVQSAGGWSSKPLPLRIREISIGTTAECVSIKTLDERFLAFMNTTFPSFSQVVENDKYLKRLIADWHDILKTFDGTNEDSAKLNLPSVLRKDLQRIKTAICGSSLSSAKSSEEVDDDDDDDDENEELFDLSRTVIQNILQPAIDSLAGHTENLLREKQSVQLVFLTGDITPIPYAVGILKVSSAAILTPLIFRFFSCLRRPTVFLGWFKRSVT